MSRIDNPADVQAGYMYRPDDHTGVATAKRADFRPGPNDKLVNALARKEHPRAAGLVNTLRTLDLGLRRSVNTARLDSARARLDKMKQENVPADKAQAFAERRRRLEARVENLDLKDARLDLKQQLSKQARAGSLPEALPIANMTIGEELERRGYTEATGNLSKTGLRSEQSQYLVSSADGHRIRVNAERPPWLARMVASSVSAAYDRGSSGTAAAALNLAQHALVGVKMAAAHVEGAAAKGLSTSKQLDEGSRARMEAAVERTLGKRDMLRSSLQGRSALNAAFDRAVDAQQASAAQRLNTQSQHGYRVRDAVHGIKPPQTRLLERRVNQYYQAKAEAASGQETGEGGAPPAIQAGRMVRFATKVANVPALLSIRMHAGAGRAGLWRASAQSPDERTQRQREDLEKHVAREDAAGIKYGVREAAIRGRLQAFLQEPQTMEALDGFLKEPAPEEEPAAEPRQPPEIPRR
ncbi:MAG: hypothetical protein ABS43_12405 [Bordetella sp. SCN 67-23]|nr:hypothetical protein [Burkholderiales bacterium]ODS73831.1 MAG: hypothetical protein ABS43_12405 [Bordetella sp. SCN 67-23]ODU68654.1 MAG: hypothetical protein ABT00_19460 [Bordetella sp. SCN 68-11]OJW92714.1 MAG: hypothetical protein BGO71_23400 [Burkholderiales bacterium 67-32]